jgi:HSP20 family protein
MNMPAPRRHHRPVVRWRAGWPGEFLEPFGDFPQMWNRMAQFFEPGESGADAWIPTVETDETDDAYLVRAELPGMKREDVGIELRGNELRIAGEVKEEEAEGKEGAEGKPLRHRQGKFAYRTTLPADADADKIDAQLTDGILTVRVPKAAKARSRRIEIQG